MRAHNTQYSMHTEVEYVPSMVWVGTKMVRHWVDHTHDARAQRRDNTTYANRFLHDPQYLGMVEVPDYRYIHGGIKVTKTRSMKVRKANSKGKGKK